MATPAQVIANQQNSQQSTGPKTEEGKARSSRNRLSWGFASSTRFIGGEDPAHFDALLGDLSDEYQPATPTEQILVERMAHNQWISLRAHRLQGNLWDQAEAKEILRILPLMIRYQTTADRAFHKSHAELLKVQKQRGKSPIGFESKNAPQAEEAAAASAAPAPPKTAPKPPSPPAKQKKIAAVGPLDLQSMTPDEILEFVKTATPDEIMASGLL